MSRYSTFVAARVVRMSAAFWAALACVLGTAVVAHAALLLKDSFGFAPITDQGGTRYDASGNFVGVALHTDLSGLRAEFPFTSSEVWNAPGGHGVPTWGFSVSSPDPYEQYGTVSEPTPGDNGTMSLVVFPGDQQPPGKTDALLDFTPPAEAFQMSLDVIGGGTTTAIGFTSSTTTLYDNFESFGQVWMVLHGGLGQGQMGTWELHTNGLTGPSLSGTTLLQGYNPLAISYDPATHTVRGSVNGEPTAALSYTATGISGAGFEGVWTVNNFMVQTGAIPPGPPGDYNGNGVVDAADYVVWRKGIGAQTDYDLWRAHFGQVTAGGAGTLANATVPEPATLVTLLIGILAMYSRRRVAV
jgi:hypothetical protein